MRIFIMTILVLALSFPVTAGDLMRDTKIIRIASSHDGGQSDSFALEISGGTGVCTTTNVVVFPRELAPSEAAFNRRFSLALLAFTTGSSVRIHSYVDGDCNNATFIQLAN